MSDQVTVLGIKIDRYTECIWCKKKKSVFDKVAYRQPCDYCRETKKYQQYLKEKEAEDRKYMGMEDALKANKPAAVWQGRGREVVTNSKGNVIANVPYKPRPLGRKGAKF